MRARLLILACVAGCHLGHKPGPLPGGSERSLGSLETTRWVAEVRALEEGRHWEHVEMLGTSKIDDWVSSFVLFVRARAGGAPQRLGVLWNGASGKDVREPAAQQVASTVVEWCAEPSGDRAAVRLRLPGEKPPLAALPPDPFTILYFFTETAAVSNDEQRAASCHEALAAAPAGPAWLDTELARGRYAPARPRRDHGGFVVAYASDPPPSDARHPREVHWGAFEVAVREGRSLPAAARFRLEHHDQLRGDATLPTQRARLDRLFAERAALRAWLAAFLLPQAEPGWVSPMDELDPLLAAWLGSFSPDERSALLARAQGEWKRAPLAWGQLWRFRTLAKLAAVEHRCDVVETLAKRLPEARDYPERWTEVVTAARAGCGAP